MIRLILNFAYPVIISSFIAANVHSEDAVRDSVIVEPYESYGLIGKMRLSAAYFVNPSLADQADVAYFIPLKNFDENEWAEVEQLVKAGAANVSVMVTDGKFYKLVDPKLDLKFGWSSENVGVILHPKEGWKGEGVRVVSWGDVEAASENEVLGSTGLYDESIMEEGDLETAPE